MHCLVINDIILIDEKGIVHPDLQSLYRAYQDRMGSSALDARGWILHQARAWLALKMGLDLERLARRTHPVLIHLKHLPIPSRFRTATGELNERFHNLVRYLTRDDIARKLWDRLGVFDDLTGDVARRLIDLQQASLGHLNILKGNIAEVLSMPHQIRTLAAIREVYPHATLITGVRVRFAGEGASRLFSDNIIATFDRSGNLIVHHVFEVKAGYNGGLAGLEQVVRWDHRFEEGLELIVPADADVFILPRSRETVGMFRSSAVEHVDFLEVGASRRVGDEFIYSHNMPDGGTRALQLRSAQRDVITALGQTTITPQGWSSLGLDPISQLASDVERLELGLQHDEIDYLVRQLLLGRISS